MRIYSFETLPSTQRWLVQKVAEGKVEIPCAVITEIQTDGVGSRENRWVGKRGNLFASLALHEKMLPEDLPTTAISIYFMVLMKRAAARMGSAAWVKWPNDLYVERRKIGGCITAKKGEVVVVGIGVNVVDAPPEFGILDIETTPRNLLELFLKEWEAKPSWKQIFSIFRLEFDKSKSFRSHDGDGTVDLREAVLQNDGTVTIGKRRVVSRR